MLLEGCTNTSLTILSKFSHILFLGREPKFYKPHGFYYVLSPLLFALSRYCTFIIVTL